MRPRPEPLPIPTGRRFILIEFQDYDSEATQAAREDLAARIGALSEKIRNMDIKDPTTAELVLKSSTLLRLEEVELRLRKRAIWLRRSVDPTAMACYSWAWSQLRELRKRMEQEGREVFTFEEWHAARIIPAAALLGMCWHDLEVELDTPRPTRGETGYDFAGYGAAVLEEFLDSPLGISPESLGQVCNDVLTRVAEAYVGVSDLQERSDFLGVRRAPSSGPPSASA